MHPSRLSACADCADTGTRRCGAGRSSLGLQPRLVRHLQKSSRFDVPLRELPQLSSQATYTEMLASMARLLSHYRRPNFVLQLEADEARVMGPCTVCPAQWAVLGAPEH